MSEAKVWDRLAGRYDTIVRLFDTSYGQVRERLERDLPERGRVIEIAAGTGQFTGELARRADYLMATDVSPAMVDRLRRRVLEEGIAAGIAAVDCAVMSAYAIEAPDGSFDAAFCANALHVMDAPERALAELRRVLRDDGVLIAPTFLHGVDGFRHGLSQTLGLISPFVAHTRFDLVSLTRTIAAAGFKVSYAERMRGLFPLGYVVAEPLATTQEQRSGDARGN
ncbi:MAG: class I SAM-dependent methyltransferase [Deltaproteobacteria bacterium]|nr:class I SAM-dependent methyltransferase [Deltaproteobacteria bacterium]